ncbi:MAG TPA: heavy metal translocating P-type ATPase [Elusimicrobiales bacterium]|jgi:Cd2+/Zn2+-exporting ATPase|nr:heavy metal translocating P-type ATPase [Elusimicrobiales bacterium]
MKTSTFTIENMDCRHEEALIRERLGKMPEVGELVFDLPARRLTAAHTLPGDEPILAALREIGMEAAAESPEKPCFCCKSCSPAEAAPPAPAAALKGKTVSVFVVEDMDCQAEEALIRKRLGKLDGVRELSFNLLGRRLSVGHDLPGDELILAALAEVGMEAHPAPAPGAKTEAAGPSISAKAKAVLALSGAAAIASEVLVWTGSAETSPPVIGLALFSIALGGRGTLRKGWLALKTFTLNINFLMSLAVAGAVAIGEWPEAAVVIFLFALAEMIETLSLDHARNAIHGLMAMTPDTAWVQLAGGEWQEVPAGSVSVGVTARVRPGERIPLDGVVTAGSSSVNQAPITGESVPVMKAAGDQVFAGTVNERGMLEFRVTANKGNTTLARIVKSVQAAQGQRAPTQRFIDSFAAYYTPAVVALAALTVAVPVLFFGGAFEPWFYKALVMLVISCPCALVISTPVTVVSGLAAAARRGILVKGGLHLENGRLLKAVALDKTGTLTHGKPVVTDIVPLGGRSPEKILGLAAAVDAHSEHPVAAAIVAAWQNPAGGGPRRETPAAEAFESLTGRGARAAIGGRTHFVGNHRLIEEIGACSPAVEAELERLEKEGKTAVALAVEKETLGVIGVADTVRPHSAEAIRDLHALGVASALLTGDNQATAAAIAAQVGIDDARGNLLPEDKLAAMDGLLSKYGHVGMAGDGINDAPALAKASIGFAMGAAGTDTAIETADVALMDDDLRKLPQFIRLSRATSAILRQNIAMALGIKAVFLGLAFAGKATLFMAVFADMGASLLVIFNGLRLLGRRY